MTTKLIAENILEDSDFLSATEQDGVFIGQPASNSANTGSFRLISKGDIADYVNSGTATSNGSTTTMVDSSLAAFGDDWFIGAVITFLTGANTSGTATITDFTKSTGTLTWVGAVTSTTTSDTFTLTLHYATRDFIAELIAGGDAGTATFKFSHDGGSNYFGGDDPDTATWPDETEVSDIADACWSNVTRRSTLAQNGDLVVATWVDDVGSYDVIAIKSTDGGLSWNSPIYIEQAIASGYVVYGICTLGSGRLIISASAPSSTSAIFYSDDDGDTWSNLVSLPDIYFGDIAVLPGGRIVMVVAYTSNVMVRFSDDGGNSWSATPIDVDSDADSRGAICVNQDGDILVAYETDIASAGDYDIKGKISTDSGATWSSRIDIIDFVGNMRDPHIFTDLAGVIYAVANDATNETIELCKSIDKGYTFNASTPTELHNAGNSVSFPDLVSNEAGKIFCIWSDNNTTIQAVSRGGFEPYSANAITVPSSAQETLLACGVKVVWHGGAGIVGDKWTFEPKYQYAMSNIISDSPSKPWRSETDGAECNIVIDLGINERFKASGVGFFGCNIRALSFQMNATDSWGAPTIDESVSFDLATGEADEAANGNTVKDTSLLANYKDHELKGLYLQDIEAGVARSGATWKIKDNVGDYIVLDTTAASGIENGDAFAIFQGSIVKTFTGGLYQFVRISIPAQQTADDYYQIGAMVIGEAITLTRPWAPRYGKTNIRDITYLETPYGGMIPIKGAERRRAFQLDWTGSDDTREEVIALADYIDGKSIAMVPDSDTLTDCYLVKLIGDIEQKHRYGDMFDFSIKLKETL